MGAFEWVLVGLIMLGIVPVLLRPLRDLQFPRLNFGRGGPARARGSASPRRMLRREIRALGGKPRRIPAAALDEIIARETRLAADLAASGLSAYANPKETLARALKREAAIIVRLMRGERLICGSEDTLRILAEHRVVQERGVEVLA